MIANYFKTIGIDPARVMIEDRSRTTFENAVFSRALANPKPGERWLLVTSAWHMPRSVGVFRKAGFDVTAYPVDYRTGSTWWDQEIFASMSEGLRRLDVGAKEWTGLVAYHFAGLTSALLPAPQRLADRQPVDSLKIVGIYRSALSQNDDPALFHEPDRCEPNRLHQRPPALGLVASERPGDIRGIEVAAVASPDQLQHLRLDVFSGRVLCHASSRSPRVLRKRIGDAT